jgi:hypothetical protein
MTQETKLRTFHKRPGQELAAGTDEKIRVTSQARLLVFETTPRNI